MPWRLIGIIAVMAVLLVFIGFNVGPEYSCKLNLVFHEFESVPVFLTIFFSFMLGILFSMPFFFMRTKPKKEKSAGDHEKSSETGEESAGKRKKPFGGRKNPPDSTDTNGSYGID